MSLFKTSSALGFSFFQPFSFLEMEPPFLIEMMLFSQSLVARFVKKDSYKSVMFASDFESGLFSSLIVISNSESSNSITNLSSPD